MKLIIVEKGTIEGFTTAWVVKRQFKDRAEVIGVGPEDPPVYCTGRDVAFFGVVPPREQVKRIAKAASSFALFDYRFLTKQELGDIKGVHVNLKRTAARMAWESIRADFSIQLENKLTFRFDTAPWIVDYSRDVKLWRWPALNPFFLTLAIENCYKRTLEDWDILATRDVNVVIEQGKQYAKLQQNLEQPTEERHDAVQPETPKLGADKRRARRNARK